MKKKTFAGVVTPVVLAGALLATIAFSADAATTTPAATQAVTGSIPNTKGAVTGWHVKDGSLYCADLGPGMCAWFTAGPFNNSVNTYTVKDGSLGLVDFSAAAKAGLKGAKGDKGDTGATGPKGDPATDAFGKEGGSAVLAPKPIATIGGSWVTGKTELGSITLPAGTWLVNAAVTFDRLNSDDAGYLLPATDTMPQFALRYGITDANKFGEDAGTVMGNPVSRAGFVELTGSSVKTVKLDAETTITAYGFGYNEDRSGFGGGQITAGATVSAVKVG